MSISRNKALEFDASHAFVIGINNYPLLGANLEGAINDARAVAERLCVHQGFDNVLLMEDVGLGQIQRLFDWLNSDHSRPLHIPDETFTGFEGLGESYSSNIQWLDFKPRSQNSPLSKWRRNIRRTKGPRKINYNKDKDSVVFYFAGHGFSGIADSSPRGYLAATDSVKDQNGTTSLVEMEDLQQAMDKFDCKHTLLLLDCCFSGKFRFADASRGGPVAFLVPMYAERFERYKQGKAWQVLTSSGPNQTAADLLTIKDLREHSPFASTLVQALEGKADIPGIGVEGRLKDGIITASELFLYVSDKVEALTRHDRPQNPSLFPMKKHGNGEFIFINPALDIEQFQFPEDPRNNPYKGLKSFEVEDQKLFYGREKDIKGIVEQLLAEKENKDINRVLFVSGSSSAGKSSIVQAGVFPILQRKYELEEKEIHFIKVRPNDLVEQSKDIKRIRNQEIPGNEKFENVLSKLKSEDNYLLFIDQYEEIFTHPSEDILEIRVQQLFDAAVAQADNLMVFSLRSDFEWKIKASKLDGYFKNETTFRLPPMDLKSLRRALVGPAFWALSQFENKKQDNGNMDEGEGLINRILADVANAPGALSILSFTMFRMYQLARAKERVNGVYTFTHQMYEEMGGVDGAISSRADHFYNELASSKEKLLMKHLFLRMVTIYDGSYARRRVYFSEIELDNTFSLTNILQEDEASVDLYFANANLSELRLLYGNEELKELIDELERANLIVQDKDEFGQSYVEPAHDALIKHWNRCRVWLDELDKDSLMLRRQLWDNILDAQLIIQQQEEENMQNMAVAEVQSADDIVLSISPFWDANPKLDSILASIINHFRPKEEKQASIKEKENNNILSLLSEEALALYRFFISNPINNPQINLSEILIEYSIETILELFEKSHHWMNEVELFFIYRSILRKEQRFQKLKAERDAAEKTAQRATSNLILNNANLVQNRSASFRLAEMAGIIDRNNPKVLEQLFKDYYGLNNSPSVHYHHITYLRIDPQQPGFERSFGLAISDLGKYYAIGDHKNIRIFDASNSREIANWKAHDHSIWALCFALNDQFLVSASQDKKIKIWRKPDDHTLEKWPLFKTNNDHQREVTALAVSNDGSKIVSGSFELKGKIRIWENWQDSNATSTLIGEQNRGIESLSISPDGEKIMAKSSEYKVWQQGNEQWTSQKVEVNSIHGDIIFSLDGQSFYAIFGIPQSLMTLNRFDFDQEESRMLLDNNIQGFTLNHDQTEIVLIDKQGKLLIYTFDPINKTITKLDHEIPIPKRKLLNWTSCENARFFLFQEGAEVIFMDRKNQQEQLQSKIDASTFKIESKNTITPFNLDHSPNKKYLVASYSGREKLHILNAKDKTIVRTIEHDADIFSFAFSPDDSRIYTGDGIGRIHAWSIENNHSPILVSEEVALNTSSPINALIFVKETNELILNEDRGDVHLMGAIEIPEDHVINELLPIHQMEEIPSNTLSFSYAEKTSTLAVVLHESILIWPLSTQSSQKASTLFDFDGIPGTVKISPSSQYLSYFRKGEIIIHSFDENGKIYEDPYFEFDTDFSEWTIGKITYNEDESLILFTTGNTVLAWSLESGKRIFNLNFENKFSAAPKGCLLLPNGQNTLENFFPTGSKLILLSSLPSNIIKLTELEFSIESLLEASRTDGDIGGLLPEEIAQFEITEYFPNLGLVDKQGVLEYSDQFKDERSLISFGDYFFERGFNMNFVNQKRTVLQKALHFYEAAAAIGEVLTSATYEIVLNDIQHILDELP